MKRKKNVIILLLIVVIGVIGFTIAYFSNQVELDNIFKTKKYKTRLKEEFVSPDNWLPGDTTPKVFSVVNTGEIDEAVRVSYTEEWVSKDGTTILSNWIDENGNSTTPTSNTSPDEKVAVINFGNSRDWTKENGYFYYNYKLAPGEETTALIDSVTFNNKAKANVTCGSANVVNGETIIDCEAANTGYADATYKLTFKVDTVQYENYDDAWDTDVYIVSARNEIKGLIANPLDADYNDYTKGRMFTFEHEATEQTPALTDYRYVGDDPDNYVYFNCDDENDVSTCEVWRIIGVFDVDDGNGNYERRIKLLRGNMFQESFVWDENNINDWKQSTLQQFLNGDYYNRTGRASEYGLKENARNMIGDAKYYLADSSCCSGDFVYKYERSTIVYDPTNNSWDCPDGLTEIGQCAKRDLNWVGKVGLIYPSDFAYSYKTGYKNWVSVSQKIDGYGINYILSWTITPTNSMRSVHLIDNDNYTTYSSQYPQGYYSENSQYCYYGSWPNCYYGTRPVIYLNSDIMVISGSGTFIDPYKLGIVKKDNIKHEKDIDYKSYKIGEEVIFDGNKYYVLQESNNKKNYVTLLKADLLTDDEINQFGENYVSVDGEYPYYESERCNSTYNMEECEVEYEKSSVNKLINNWSLKYDNQLEEVNGYRARILSATDMVDNLKFGFWLNDFYYLDKYHRAYWTYIYSPSSDSPNWIFIDNNKYWTMSIAFSEIENTIYVVDNDRDLNNNLDIHTYVFNKYYIRPVINLKKCAINGGCTKY